MLIRLPFYILLLLLISGKYNIVSGQRFQNMRQAEDTLSAILKSLNLATADSSKTEINSKFCMSLSDALRLPSSDNYPFDSLKTLVKIIPPDHKFRIFHWNLPSVNGKHRYYGFIKMLNHEPPLVYPLVDISDSLSYPDTAMMDNLHWFGALYYKIIAAETPAGKTIYTLLGWAGKNSIVTQKVIEVLYFDDKERPHFGIKLFPDFQTGNMTRIIFRFSAETSMSMKYEKQTISSNKRWNSKKREFEYTRTETQMIVFDRMVPLDPQLEGQYQYYVAAGDIYDGFLFTDNCWKYHTGIDTRNK
jgi:hypothetical protein